MGLFTGSVRTGLLHKRHHWSGRTAHLGGFLTKGALLMQFAKLTPCKLRFINWTAVLIITQNYSSIFISKKQFVCLPFIFARRFCASVSRSFALWWLFSALARAFWESSDRFLTWTYKGLVNYLIPAAGAMKIDRFRYTKLTLTCLNTVLHEICMCLSEKSLTWSFRLSISSPRLITSCSSWLTLGIWLLTVKLNVFTRFWKKAWI